MTDNHFLDKILSAAFYLFLFDEINLALAGLIKTTKKGCSFDASFNKN